MSGNVGWRLRVVNGKEWKISSSRELQAVRSALNVLDVTNHSPFPSMRVNPLYSVRDHHNKM